MFNLHSGVNVSVCYKTLNFLITAYYDCEHAIKISIMLNQPIGSCTSSFLQGGTVYKGESLCVFLFRTVLRWKINLSLTLHENQP